MTFEIKNRIKKINNGEVPDGYKRTKVGIVPDEWKETKLSNYLEVSNDKNTNLKYGKNDVFSISGELGVVNQIELLGRSYAGASVAQYGIVCPNDIVYTKSPLKANPYGIIKTNKSGKYGIVSTLYAIFHCKDNVLPDYVQLYFDSNQNLNNYLYPIVNIGAKHDMKISDENSLMGNVVFPPLAEQKKIAEILATQDKIIELKERKIEELKKLKKYYLNKMFPQKGSNYPEVRFPGFTDPWKQCKLGDCFSERNESMPDGELISVTINDGIKKFSELGRHDNSNEDKSKYKKVCIGDIAYNSMRMWQGASGYSPYEGIVSPAYTVLSPNSGINSKCLAYQFKLPEMIHTFQVNSQGITSDNWNLKYPVLSKIEIFVSKDEQEQAKIAEYFENLDNLITLHQRELEEEKQKKKALAQLLLTGIVRV